MIVLGVVLACLTFFPIACMVVAWCYYGWRSAYPLRQIDEHPFVAVIMSLRGADPSLEACLAGVLTQDYPAYAVHIVIDRRDDPAWTIVANAMAHGHPPNVNVRVEVREDYDEHRSLKLSAQRQALTKLGDPIEVVAFLDSDSVPPPTWLRALVAPLADARVGATTGIRWSVPPDAAPGTLVRHVFNALAFPQMYVYRIPWGGSFAVRKRVLREAGLIERWSRSFCEDTSAFGPIRSHGLRLAFAPGATLINNEPTDLLGARNFMLRQLVCVRLHHIYWLVFLAANLGAVLSFVVCCILASVGALALPLGLSAISPKLMAFGIIPATYFACALALQSVGEQLVHRVVLAPLPALGLGKRTWAMLVTLYLTTHAMFAAPLARSINWRGITYDIIGRDRIRLRAYQPYVASNGAPAATRSI